MNLNGVLWVCAIRERDCVVVLTSTDPERNLTVNERQTFADADAKYGPWKVVWNLGCGDYRISRHKTIKSAIHATKKCDRKGGCAYIISDISQA